MTWLKTINRYFWLTFLAIITIAPILLGVWASLLPTADIAAGNFLSTHISLANYIGAIQTTPVLRYIANSFVTSMLITLGELVFCTLAAYVFVFIDFRFKKQLFFVFLITMMLPFEAQIIPNFQTIRSFGWLNSYAGLTIPFFASAFGVFMLRQAFLKIPSELQEYSEILGMNHMRFLMGIVLPYSRSTIVTFVIYMFLTHWNAYLWPLITTFTDAYRPTQVGLKQLQAEDTFSNWGVIMATAILILIPTLIVLIIGQRYFKKGLNVGGAKG
ncbi:carbohydrate ABC transporter permease [Agrilactobacillus fermenti]|uniref:carbohydrate ABC transporter permease n=1 Tax=Agrilactobacillus fermenti TaxID=2586909 RepID=UPI003A5BA1E6